MSGFTDQTALLELFQRFTSALAQKYTEPHLQNAVLSSFKSKFLQESLSVPDRHGSALKHSISLKLVSPSVYFFKAPVSKEIPLFNFLLLVGLSYFLNALRSPSLEKIQSFSRRIENNEFPFTTKDSMAQVHLLSVFKKAERLKTKKKLEETLQEITRSVFSDEFFHSSLVLLASDLILSEISSGKLDFSVQEKIKNTVFQLQMKLKEKNFKTESERKEPMDQLVFESIMQVVSQKIPVSFKVLEVFERVPKEKESALVILVRKSKIPGFALLFNSEVETIESFQGYSSKAETGRSCSRSFNEDFSCLIPSNKVEALIPGIVPTSVKVSLDENSFSPVGFPENVPRGLNGISETSGFINRIPLRRAMSKDNCPGLKDEKPPCKGISHYANISLVKKESMEGGDSDNQKKKTNEA